MQLNTQPITAVIPISHNTLRENSVNNVQGVDDDDDNEIYGGLGDGGEVNGDEDDDEFRCECRLY